MGSQMQVPDPDKANDQAAIAKNAGLAFLGQTGAVVEALGLLVFTWLYETAVVGLFFTLWAALKVLTAITEFAMTTSQQRFTPATTSQSEGTKIFKAAIFISTLVSFGGAFVMFVFAPEITHFLKGGTIPDETLITIIRIYVWALPLWTLVEVVTASIRAQQKFGPEIRIRVFYEQIFRLIAGVALFYLGFQTLGIFYAHIISILIASILAFRLATRFYDFKALFRTPINPVFLKELLSFSVMMMPANLIKKFFIVGSVIIVNVALGPAPAAIYGLGRHISSVLQVVHLSFEYVMAPFASLKNALAKKQELQNVYAFTTRLIAALVLPLGILLIYISRDLLTVFRPDYAAATGVIIILTAGRITEALTGTSAAIIEMLGNKFLPLLNNVLGVTVLLILQYYLKDDRVLGGVYGIALATAIGFNVISVLSLIQVWFLYKLSPYTKATLHPLLVSIGLSTGLVILFIAADYLPHAIHFSIAILSIFGALWLLVRFGISEGDARALGRIGRWVRKSLRIV